jgi:hypothetical protein
MEKRERARSRWIACAIASASMIALNSARPAKGADAIWNGGNGVWNVPANWTGGIPNSLNVDVSIDGGKSAASSVTLNVASTVRGLWIDADDALTISDGSSLNLQGDFSLNGTLTLASSASAAEVTFANSQTVWGSGQILFGGNGATNFIYGGPLSVSENIAIRTASSGGTIRGSSLDNRGLISAETAGRTLNVNATSFVNEGTLQATAGTLAITSIGWTNSGTIVLSGSGLLQLGGGFTTAGLGNLVRTGGTIDITGTLDNTGSTLALNGLTGSFNLKGTIRGGTIAAGTDGSALLMDHTGGTFDGVRLDCDYTLGDGVVLGVNNGLTLANGHTLTIASSGLFAGIYLNNGDQTLGGDGQVLFAGSSSLESIRSGSALTIGPGIAVRTAGQSGSLVPYSLINQGILSAESAGQSLELLPSTFLNQGTVQASAGTFEITASSWTNTGTFNVSGDALLELDGKFTTAGLGTLIHTGGTIDIIGTLDNTGETLRLDAPAGLVNLNFGTLVGGTLATGVGGAGLVISKNKSGSFTGVQLDTDFTLNSASLGIRNGLTLLNSHRLTLVGGSVAVIGDQSLLGTGEVVFDGTSNSSVSGAGLVVGSGIVVRTGAGGGSINSSALTNQGLISAETTGQKITIGGASFINQGTVAATAGTIAITASSWTNSGTFSLASGATLQMGGTFRTEDIGTLIRSGGTLDITGTLDNTGDTLAIDSSIGPFNLRGGTIRGGVVVSSSSEAVITTSTSLIATLDGVDLNANLAVPYPTTLALAHGLTLEAGRTVALDGELTMGAEQTPQTISGGGEIRFGTRRNTISGAGALIIGADISVRGGTVSSTISVASFTNQGLISEDALGTGGRTLTISSAHFVNDGRMVATGAGNIVASTGVTGTGSIQVDAQSTVRSLFLRQNSLTIGGKVTVSSQSLGGQTSVLKSLNITADELNQPLGTLDLADNGLVLDYEGESPIGMIRAALASGYSGGTWSGKGIISSKAATDHGKALGYVEAGDLMEPGGGMFEDQPVDGTAIVVKYVLVGDADFDGAVGFSDLVAVAQHYGDDSGEATWSMGDFNYDGRVNFVDLVEVAQNYGSGVATASTGEFISRLGDDWAAAQAAVPEPRGVFSVAMFLAGGLALRPRYGARRRRG